MVRICQILKLVWRQFLRRRSFAVGLFLIAVVATTLWRSAENNLSNNSLTEQEKSPRGQIIITEVNFQQYGSFENDRFKRYFRRNVIDNNRSNQHGELGRAFYTNNSGFQLETERNITLLEGVNLVVSNSILLNRSLLDYRNPLCRLVEYKLSELPKASVIIVFTNEPWSTLLRTAHSVVNRSLPKVLKEVILVDDFSNREDVSVDRLLSYIEKEWKDGVVRLERLKGRSGLVKARLAGARVATADVLVFLDAHCEVTDGWLEPLLARLVAQPNTIVSPIIDSINATTFQYQAIDNADSFVGGFWWSLHFSWRPLSRREAIRRSTPIDPIRSPTMAGGLFAVRKKYFFEIGAYDDGMEVWGGENLELSFRCWMCAGCQIELIPCSRVGHVFRSFHPYSFPGNKDYHGINSARLAEVWMDDYKRLFYSQRPDLKGIDFNNISQRKKLRQQLNCTTFKQYLQTVYPEKFVTDEQSSLFGVVLSAVSDRRICLDTLGQDEKFPFKLGIYPCQDGKSQNQVFFLSIKQELRREESCAEPLIVPTTTSDSLDINKHRTVLMTNCARGYEQQSNGKSISRQTWHFDDGLIRNNETNLCISSRGIFIGEPVILTECDRTQPHQIWKWMTI